MSIPSRQITSPIQTHRSATLSSIAAKHQALNSRIQHSGALAASFRKSLQDLEKDMPDDLGSRLDWLQKQLNNRT